MHQHRLRPTAPAVVLVCCRTGRQIMMRMVLMVLVLVLVLGLVAVVA